MTKQLSSSSTSARTLLKCAPYSQTIAHQQQQFECPKIVVSNSTQKLFSSSAIPGVRKDGQLKEFCFCLAKDNLTTKQKSCLYYTSSSTLTPSSSSPNCCCWSALKTSCETLIGTQIVVRSWTYWQTRLFQTNSLEDRETFPDQLDLRGFPDKSTLKYKTTQMNFRYWPRKHCQINKWNSTANLSYWPTLTTLTFHQQLPAGQIAKQTPSSGLTIDFNFNGNPSVKTALSSNYHHQVTLTTGHQIRTAAHSIIGDTIQYGLAIHTLRRYSPQNGYLIER